MIEIALPRNPAVPAPPALPVAGRRLPVAIRAHAPAHAPAPGPVGVSRSMMGGAVSLHVTGGADIARLDAVLDRIEAWASRLTRFDRSSELMRLNAARTRRVRIGPTMTAVLDWARAAEGITDGLVDVAMLDARLAAEAGTAPKRPISASRRWSIDRGPRASAVRRQPGVRFDLDGVAKGWLADRALAIAPGRSAMVDADGDIALRLAPGDRWGIAIADPRQTGALLGVLQFSAEQTARRLGVATSGTSVHRWAHVDGDAHHLIDPRTLRSAATDVVQATVVAATAREAEVLAKTAVIAGSERAFQLLDRPAVLGVLILTTRGEVRATPETLQWLA